MAHHAIGGNGLRGLGQQQVFLGSPTPTRGTGFGIDHDATDVDQSLLQKGQQAQQRSRGEAAWCGHQPGLPDPIGLPLRQAINGALAEMAVAAHHLLGFLGIHPLPLVEGAVAVVGGKIHHPHPPFEQGRGKLGR